MQIREIDTAGGVLAISTINESDSLKIEYYRGKDISVTIPEAIEGKKVTAIGKKAFLGAKTLSSIYIKGQITEIGDWAFASCSELKEIHLPASKITLGNGLFKDCPLLQKIVVDGIPQSESISYLLAICATGLDAQYLIDPASAGSNEWLSHFDGIVRGLLTKDDTEGFSKMLLCGEEDYVGSDSNLNTYILLRVKEKIRIILLRLINDIGLSAEDRIVFSDYLNENFDNATLPLVLSEHGGDQEYFDLLIENKCINADNISGIISQMGDRNTQMKGYLIKKKSEYFGGTGNSFFDDLEL